MSRADLAQNLRDPKVHARRLGAALVNGLWTATVVPAKLSTRRRRGLHALSGTAGAGATYWFVRRDEGDSARALPVAGVVGVLVVGASVLGSAVDASAEAWLTRRGVRRPRLVMALAAGLGSWARLWVEDLKHEQRERTETDAEPRAEDEVEGRAGA